MWCWIFRQIPKAIWKLTMNNEWSKTSLPTEFTQSFSATWFLRTFISSSFFSILRDSELRYLPILLMRFTASADNDMPKTEK